MEAKRIKWVQVMREGDWVPDLPRQTGPIGGFADGGKRIVIQRKAAGFQDVHLVEGILEDLLQIVA